jgi:hypothetical protein
VVTALTVMHPGVNYQYDQEAWRRWYARQATPTNVNLRRDD